LKGNPAVLGEVDPKKAVRDTLVNLDICDVSEDGEFCCERAYNLARSDAFLLGAITWSTIADERCQTAMTECQKASDEHWAKAQECEKALAGERMEQAAKREMQFKQRDKVRKRKRLNRLIEKMRELAEV